jgi:O-antigen ligase
MALKIITYLALFLFPTMANLVEHAGSTAMVVLVILGIFAWMTRTTAPAFTRHEKNVLWSFALYFLATLCFYIGHSFFKENFSLNWELRHWELRHEVRMLGIIPLFYLLHRTGLKRWVLWYGSATAAILAGAYSIFYIYVISYAPGLAEAPRATGAYHPIAFGDLSLALGFISLSGIRYFQEKHKLLILVPAIALLGGILACFLSGTRMAFVAIPFLALIFFFQLGTFGRPWAYRLLTISTIIILSVSFYHLPKSPLEHRLKAGIAGAKAFFEGKSSGHYAVHLVMWSQGWELFSKHPFIGSGNRGYEKMIKEKAAAGQIPVELEKFTSPHNMYLANMDAYGITGLFILMGIFLTPLPKLIRAARTPGAGRDIAYAGIMLVVAFMLFGTTETIFIRNVNINFYVILLAVIITLIREFEHLNIREK